ncbi:MAG: tetratricopeptide repeat protein [Desulfococcaceae bacterium]|jgi:tetratricopeptide (TPR) repeat protein|nr:tetratricopeptide repeat protein [Desulfococcaceae bacterium]
MSKKKKKKRKSSLQTSRAALSPKKTDPGHVLKEAFAHHQAGRLEAAEKLYRDILAAKPDVPDALHLLGVICYQTGRFPEAEMLIRKALAIHSASEAYWSNLGNVCKSLNKNREAVDAYKKALEINPDYAEAHFNMGVTYKVLGRSAESVAAYSKAVKCKPDYAEAYSNMANEMREQGRLKEAIACYQKAVEIRPDYAEAYNNMGNAYKDTGNMNRAETFYRKALDLSPEYIQALNNLGNVLNDLGRLDEASSYYKKALKLQADCDWAFAGEAKVRMRKGKFREAFDLLLPRVQSETGNVDVAVTFGQVADRFDGTDQAIALMEKVLARQGLSTDEKRQLHFNLGRLYDRNKDFDRAFTHFRGGNALRPNVFRPEHQEKYLQNLMSVYSKENRASLPSSSRTTEQPVFIVGMPRSGTSLVEQILASHPMVFGAGELAEIVQLVNSLKQECGSKAGYPEPECILSLNAAILDRQARKYLDRLHSIADGEYARITDKMPQNFMHLGYISQLFPNARIIHCIRDPKDTGLSIYFQNFSGGHTYAFDLKNIGIYYRQYRKLMAHWKAAGIPMLDVHYEDMVERQEEISRKMLEYIGMEWDERCLTFHKTDRPVITASFHQVRQPIYKRSVQRWKNYEKYILPMVTAIEQSDNTDSLFSNALRQHQQGHRNKARAMYEQVLAESPNHADALQLLGLLMHQSGDHEKGLSFIRRAIHINPFNAVYHFNLGIALKEQEKEEEAEEAYRKALEIEPDYAEAYYNLGNLLKDRQETEEAIQCYQQAVRIRPAYAKAYTNMGNLLRDRGEPAEAIEQFKKAIEIRPDYPEAYNNMANACKECGQLEDAIACSRKAIELKPDFAEAYNSLGGGLRDRGHFQDALKAFARARELKPDLTAAVSGECDVFMKQGDFDRAYESILPLVDKGADNPDIAAVYAQLADRFGHHREAIALLESLLEKKMTGVFKYRSLHFELGSLYHSVGEYERAFFHYRSGNELNRSRYDAQGHENFISAMINLYRPENMARLPRADCADDTTVFIVGMPRSGTTLAEQILSSHSKIYGAGELLHIAKTVRAFQKRGMNGGPQYPDSMTAIPVPELKKTAEHYLLNIRKFSADAARITDKMPQNFLHLGLIWQMFSRVRIIHCVRDARDTGLSIYFQNFMDTHTYAFDLKDIGHYYRQYERITDHWKNVLDLPVLDVHYEELIKNQEEISRRMLEFVGLDWEDDCMHFHKNRRDVSTASFQQVRKPIYTSSAGKWVHYEKYIRPLTESLTLA